MDLKCISKITSKCCGCGACAENCPVNAIKIEKNSLGFIYPNVSSDVCINCGACVKICPFERENQKNLVNEPATETYAAAMKDDSMLFNSASGGVFAGLAKYILDQNGVVYGAAWNADFSVEHIKIENLGELNKLQGSKYTQSNITKCYKEIRTLLQEGLVVLFSGTPCQVASLKSFLKKDYDSLYTVDLICHGVGSPAILHDEIAYIEKKYGKKLKGIKFRSKRKGWGTSGDLVFDDGIKDYSVTNSPYYYYYLQNALFRDSCYNCPFASDKRPADITVGDYWRIESAHPDIKIKTEKGISCVLANTEKGSRLIKSAEALFELVPSTLEKIKARNVQLRECCVDNGKKAKIIQIYQENGYDGLIKYYRKEEAMTIFIEKVKKNVPRCIKTMIKKVSK